MVAVQRLFKWSGRSTGLTILKPSRFAICVNIETSMMQVCKEGRDKEEDPSAGVRADPPSQHRAALLL